MKKLLLLVAIAGSTAVSAQTKFGLQLGGNIATTTTETTSGGVTTSLDSDSKFGFIAGVVAELPVATSISFRPELNYIQKGGKYNFQFDQGPTVYKVVGETKMNFIELPLNLVYNARAGAGSLFFGAGPSIGFGISGSDEYTSTYTFGGQTVSDDEERNIKFDGKKASDLPANDVEEHLKPLDFGANFLAGYKLNNGFFINLGYTVGLSNLAPNEGESFKTKGLSIKLGMMFSGK